MFSWVYHGYHIGTGWWLLMFGGMLIPLALVVMLVWLVVRALKGWSSGPEDPLHVLKVRYARGEIIRDEYVKMREDLQA